MENSFYKLNLYIKIYSRKMNFLKKSIFSQSLSNKSCLSNLTYKNSLAFIIKKNFYFSQAKHGAGDVRFNFK